MTGGVCVALSCTKALRRAIKRMSCRAGYLVLRYKKEVIKLGNSTKEDLFHQVLAVTVR